MSTKTRQAKVTLLVTTALLCSLPALAQSIDLTGYTLTFSDEFDTLSLSSVSPKGSATWYGYAPNGATGNFSASVWDPAGVSVADGIVSLKTWKDVNGVWHSGYLSSIDTTGAGFTQKFGYFEAKCQMPDSGTGAWPAFWLDTTSGLIDHTTNMEVDIFEWYGVVRDQNQLNYMQGASHNWNPDGSSSGGFFSHSLIVPQPPSWQGFHQYGVLVDPVNVTWYIDRQQVGQYPVSMGYLTTPFAIILDNAIGGGWPLTGVVDGASLKCDYVKVYAPPPPPPPPSCSSCCPTCRRGGDGDRR